ncbi:MAG: flippase-like domain-containing protein [Nitrospinae bacterium]|nr:flippase-like domain-containing protein [Nitrospinota bacterium]
MKKSHLFIGLLIAVGALYYCMHNISIPELIKSFSKIHWFYLIPMFMMIIVQFILRAYRWSYLINPLKVVTTKELMPSLYIGFMCNLLPARLGEAIRAFVLSKKIQLPFTACIGTIFIERLFDILLLGISLIICLFFYPEAFIPKSVGGNENIVTSIKAFGVMSAVLFVALMVFSYTLAHWHDQTVVVVKKFIFFLKESWQEKILLLIGHFSDGLGVLKSAKETLIVFLLSAILWGCFIVTYLPAYYMYDLQDLPIQSLFILTTMVCIFITIIPTPAFIGSFQMGVVFTLSDGFGVDHVTSNSFGLIVWFFTTMFTVLGGIYYLFKENLSLTQLVKEEQEAEGQ